LGFIEFDQSPFVGVGKCGKVSEKQGYVHENFQGGIILKRSVLSAGKPYVRRAATHFNRRLNK
jgi:hypothetical protein